MSESATIVTAFYSMDSKFPSSKYMEWLQRFFSEIPCYLVIYTDADLVPLFEHWRRDFPAKTRVIPLPREQWTAYTKYGKGFWEQQRLLDREAKIHSADLYAIWYEKMHFVQKAIDLNPFGHSRYIWCDAGAFRYPEWLPLLKTFGSEGVASKIPAEKVTLLQVEPFTEDDSENFLLNRIGQFDDRNRIGGGIQAGPKDVWSKWISLYDGVLEERVQRGLFVGKDQTILATLVLRHPGLVHMIEADRSLKDHWFTLLHTFSPKESISNPFFSILIPLYNGVEFLPQTLQSLQRQNYEDFEILIGVNGWPANSEVYQQALVFQSPKVRIFDFPNCEGKAATLNALVKESKADWIALCDADDLWLPYKLRVQYDCIQHFPHFDVFGTLCDYFGDLSGSPNLPIGDLSDFDFFSVNPLLHSAVVLRKSLASWNSDNRILEDYELWLRLRYQKQAKIINIPYKLMLHRIHKTSYFNGQNARAVPDLLNRLRAEFNQT